MREHFPDRTATSPCIGSQHPVNRRQFVAAFSAALAGCAGNQPFFNSSVNVAFDGNSLTYGAVTETTHVSDPYPSQVAALPPMAGSGASGGKLTNFGVNGTTWTDMSTLAPNALDKALIPGSTNILIAWETINTVANAYSSGYGTSSFASYVTLNASDCGAYVAARRSAGWSIILLISSIPHERFLLAVQIAPDVPALNQILIACDEDMRIRRYGADGYIDLRYGGPFDFVANGWTFEVGTYPGGPLTDSGFDQLAYIYGDGGLWLPAAIQPPGSRIHLSNGGYAIVAERVAKGLRSLT